MDAVLEVRKREIVATFREIDETLADLPEGAIRVHLERDNAIAKQEAAALLPDQEGLRAFRRSAAPGRYAGVAAAGDETDGKMTEIVARTEDDVREVAARRGLDGDAMVARYAGGAVPEIMAEKWARDELVERASARRGGAVLDGVPPDERALFEREIGAAHREIAALYETARAELRAQELTRAAIRAAALGRSPGDEAARPEEAEQARELRRQPLSLLVRDALTETQRARLEEGDASALDAVTADPAEQARVGRDYLEAAARDATGAERARLEAARKTLSAGREADFEAEARERVRRMREGRDDDDGFSL